MRRIMLKSLFILLVLAATTTSCTSAPEFELLGRELFEGPARNAACFDGGMILAAGGAVIVIPDGTPPGEGVFLPLGGKPMDIEIIGSKAWIAVNGIGLVGLDLYDLANPKVWTAYEIADIRSCASVGSFLIVGGDRSGLYLFEADSTPFSDLLSLLSHVEGPAPGIKLASAGNLTAAVSGSEVILIQIIFATDSLYEISRFEAPSKITAVELKHSILHLLSPEGVVYRYNVDDSRQPESISPLPEKNISDICLIGRGGGLALLESGRIVPFPVPLVNRFPNDSLPAGALYTEPLPSDPQYSLMRGEGITKSPSFPGTSIRCSKDRLITFGPKTGFNFYKNEKGYSRAKGSIPANGFAMELTVRGDYIYLANGRDGLRIGRIDKDGAVEWTGHVQTDEARDVAIEDDVLVLADGASGIRFYRITVPDSPALLSTWESLSYLSAVKLRAGRAYLAGGLRGIEVVDFMDPTAPSLVWNEKLSEVRGLDVDDNHLYVADGFDGFRIYSLAGDVPQLVSTMDTPGWASDLCVSGDLLHIADGQRGFMTVDISDRTAPAKLGRIELGAIARTLDMRGNVVFIATQTLGITAVDVSNPRKPVVSARYRTVDDARGAFADDRFVYLASGSGGLYIFRYLK